MNKKYFVVTRERGTSWDSMLPMRKQSRWDEHAAFMDKLAGEGSILLGGPLGEGENTFLLIFDTKSEKNVEKLLSKDPWTDIGMLRIARIETWEILLRKPELSG